MKDFFADRFANIHIAQGVARLDFARVDNIDTEKKQMQMSPSMRLALPLEAFLQMAEQIAKVREELLSQAKNQQPDVPGAGSVN